MEDFAKIRKQLSKKKHYNANKEKYSHYNHEYHNRNKEHICKRKREYYALKKSMANI